MLKKSGEASGTLDYEQSLSFLKSVKQNETQMATCMTDGNGGTKKERLPTKPGRMVFHGLVIF